MPMGIHTGYDTRRQQSDKASRAQSASGFWSTRLGKHATPKSNTASIHSWMRPHCDGLIGADIIPPLAIASPMQSGIVKS